MARRLAWSPDYRRRRPGHNLPGGTDTLLRFHLSICMVVQMSIDHGRRPIPTPVTTYDLRLVDPGKVAATRERMPAVHETDNLAEWFKVLGDATRARILYALLEAGELCVGDLSAAVDVPESTASHALRWLRTAGVVRARRSGRMAYYSLDDEHVRMLLDIGREHLRHRKDGHS